MSHATCTEAPRRTAGTSAKVAAWSLRAVRNLLRHVRTSSRIRILPHYFNRLKPGDNNGSTCGMTNTLIAIDGDGPTHRLHTLPSTPGGKHS